MLVQGDPGVRRTQVGAVLILVLIIVLLLNIVASRVIQSATLQARMAGNSQTYVETVQLADSIARDLLAHTENFPLSHLPGLANCLPSDSDSHCDGNTLQLSQQAHDFGGTGFRSRVVRRRPAILAGQVIEIDPAGDAGPVPYDVALFEISVIVSLTGAREMQFHSGVVVPLDGTDRWIAYRRESGVDAL